MLALAVGMTASAQVKAAFKKGEAFKTPVLAKIQEAQGKDLGPVINPWYNRKRVGLEREQDFDPAQPDDWRTFKWVESPLKDIVKPDGN